MFVLHALLLFVASLFLSTPLLVTADTPCNCTYDAIIGTWTFQISAPSPHANLSCTTFKPATAYTLTLSYPDVVTDVDGHKGFFTLIYNQGVEVRIRGMNFFAFSNWTVADNGSVISDCGSTLNGWAHNTAATEWRCYSGQRRPSSDTTPSPIPAAQPSLDRCSADGPAAAQSRLSQPFRHDQSFIDAVNNAQSSFTVRRYPQFEGLTIGELEQRAGGRSSGADVASFMEQMQAGKSATTSAAHRHIDNIRRAAASATAGTAIPKAWDWRNVSGVNYVSPVRDQGQCGSCYIFSSTGMLESRIRLASNNALQPVLSTQDALSCSRYSQGCAGGFPYLTAGKYAQDFGFVEEACYPYTGVDSTPCSRKCTNSTRLWTVSNYRSVLATPLDRCTRPC